MISLDREKKPTVWSYMVLAAAVLSHVLGEGFSYGVIGLFTIAQSDRFNISITASSWTASIHLFTSIIVAPFAAFLTSCISLRGVQILGGTITVVGVGCSSLAESPEEMRFLFGFMTGFGLSLVRTASTSVVTQHFQGTWVNFTLAMLTIGSSCGLLIFPIIAYNLFLDFEFKGVMLALSVIMMLHIICGLTFFTEEVDDESKPKVVEQEEDNSMGLCNRIATTFLNVITYLPNWAYLLACCYQTFGISAFFTLMPHYIAENSSVSLNEVAQGSMTLGCAAVVGIVAISVTYHKNYNRLIPITVTPMICGAVAIGMTLVENEISYKMLMALYGLFYGILITGHMGVAHSKTLEKDERMMFSAFQIILEACGCLTGPPLTAYIDDLFNPNVGVFYSASCSIKAGGCFLPILCYEYIVKPWMAAWEEKKAEKKQKQIIQMNSYDTKQVQYQRLLQQDPEDTPYHSYIQMY
ncbi:monocarboxylate transporter 6-like [Watersipora subatra]|uniref:monocarboxylate transporter 6-like n=1 Tax=Watersipora subatra TaxID=2589382 RepID=UPI00355C4868